MSRVFVVTGTDTGLGKTVFAAGLSSFLGAAYWKPVQAGTADGTDSLTVAALTAGQVRVLPEAYRLALPASPHLAAAREGIEIATEQLALPATPRPLVVEGAGGVMVPLTRRTLFVDLFALWQAPVVLCARTTLGTINHTLLSLAALRQAGCHVHGVAFIGDANPDSEEIICEKGASRRLGRLPFLDPLTPETLAAAFRENFALGDFTAMGRT